MKKLSIITLLLLTFISYSGIVKAEISLKENDSKTKSQNIGILANVSQDRVVVSFKNEGNENYQIAILDDEGQTLHKESFTNAGVFKKRYDLGELEKGQYQISIESQRGLIAKETLIKH